MDARYAKLRLYDYFLNSRGMVVMNEKTMWNGTVADILAIDKKFVISEIEVKVCKDDLLKELKSISDLQGNGFDYPRNTKFWKHSKYLRTPLASEIENDIIPNKFYFAVPNDLVDITRPLLNNTPYGLLNLEKGERQDVVVEIKAKSIHTHTISSYLMLEIFRKLSRENFNHYRRL